MDMDQIITLINTVSKSSLSAFVLEEGGMKLSLEATRGVSFAEMPMQVQMPAMASTAVENTMASTEKEGVFISSPLVGTFYTAATEEAAPYVQVGDTVTKGQVIGIVEAMKLMNHVESEVEGVVEEILVNNEQMVEYGQPLIRVAVR